MMSTLGRCRGQLPARRVSEGAGASLLVSSDLPSKMKVTAPSWEGVCEVTPTEAGDVDTPNPRQKLSENSETLRHLQVMKGERLLRAGGSGAGGSGHSKQ